MRIRDEFDKNNIWWTSDTHFFHNNIVEYCNRPWGDIKTHDAALVANWNNEVPGDGIVFHLGDFAWTSNTKYIKELLDQLNGTIYHVRGNHCYQNRWDRDIVVKMFGGRSYDTASILIKDDELESGHSKFFMSHYPHLFWERGSVHLHGHVHSGPLCTGQSEIVPEHKLRYDVGVDNNDFKPLSYHNLKVILTKKFLQSK